MYRAPRASEKKAAGSSGDYVFRGRILKTRVYDGACCGVASSANRRGRRRRRRSAQQPGRPVTDDWRRQVGFTALHVDVDLQRVGVVEPSQRHVRRRWRVDRCAPGPPAAQEQLQSAGNVRNAGRRCGTRQTAVDHARDLPAADVVACRPAARRQRYIGLTTTSDLYFARPLSSFAHHLTSQPLCYTNV